MYSNTVCVIVALQKKKMIHNCPIFTHPHRNGIMDIPLENRANLQMYKSLE